MILTTQSWFEPVIVMVGLGVAIIINAGSNLIFGEISFVTNAAGNILQLAVSLDYSVFLIHRFTECRKQNSNTKEAMVDALTMSTSSILSSGFTTVIGFLALCLMQFGIGPDLGFALAKGIAISLITVFTFMPCLILSTYKLLDKLEHRPFVPSFKRFGQAVQKIMISLAVVFVITIIPAYLAWFIDDDKAADAVKAAVKAEYRLIDTAQAYGNERGVGEGVRTCGVPREDLFVVSKVAAEHKTYEDAKAGIDETLKKMGLDYLDMMIIHSPQPWVEVNQSENRYEEGNKEAWRALEDAYREGKLKAIGVSNFQIGDIESLLETAQIKPMVNQILLHISNTPTELVEYCQKNDILVEAYSPIAHGVILNQPEIKAMADRYGVTVPQLCIRYTIQLGTVSLPKTANPEHMKTNADVDFEISAEDMEKLKNFKHIESYGASSGFPVYGGKI